VRKELLINEELDYLIIENNKTISEIEKSTPKEVADYLWFYYSNSGKTFAYAHNRYSNIVNNSIDYNLKFNDFWTNFENNCFNLLVDNTDKLNTKQNLFINVSYFSKFINIHQYKNIFDIKTDKEYINALEEIKGNNYLVTDSNNEILVSFSYEYITNRNKIDNINEIKIDL
jgi:hypothetical protein